MKSNYNPLTYASKGAALAGMLSTPEHWDEVVQCEDTGRWGHKDDLISCDDCGKYYESRDELDDEYVCACCAVEAEQEACHACELVSDYKGSVL